MPEVKGGFRDDEKEGLMGTMDTKIRYSKIDRTLELTFVPKNTAATKHAMYPSVSEAGILVAKNKSKLAHSSVKWSHQPPR